MNALSLMKKKMTTEPHAISLFAIFAVSAYVSFCAVFLWKFARPEQKRQWMEWRLMRDKAERVENAKKAPKFAFLFGKR